VLTEGAGGPAAVAITVGEDATHEVVLRE